MVIYTCMGVTYLWFLIKLFCTNNIAAKCMFPSPPHNGAITNFSDAEGVSTITFQCNDGFVPTGQVTSTCLADGSWELDPITLRCAALNRSGINMF